MKMTGKRKRQSQKVVPTFATQYRSEEAILMKKKKMAEDQSGEKKKPISAKKFPDILLMPVIASNFDIHEKLGEGNYGVVFAATDKQKNLPVAIKIIDKTFVKWKLLHCDNGNKRVPMEGYLQQLIDHPNIVKAYDIHEGEHEIAIIMERPLGFIPLERYISEQAMLCGKAALHEEEAKKIFLQVAQAMLHCLDRGVYHQDMSTYNILIHPATLEIKIIDFGCAAMLKTSGHYIIAANEEATPPEYHLIRHWMISRKRKKGAKNLHRAYLQQRPPPVDAFKGTTWEVGVILYEMVTGKNIYVKPEVVQLKLQKTSQAFQDLIVQLVHPDPNLRTSLSDALRHGWLNHGCKGRISMRG